MRMAKIHTQTVQLICKYFKLIVSVKYGCFFDPALLFWLKREKEAKKESYMMLQ